MDIQVVALVGLILAVLIVGTQSRAWPGRPGWQYQRVFSVGFGGLLFFCRRADWLGLEGTAADGSRVRSGLDAPIWWQVAFGTVLLLLRRLLGAPRAARVTR